MDTPVSVGIIVTFIASSAATFDPTGPWGEEVWFDSLTMFVFFLLGGRYLELKARDRTAGALDHLMNRLPELAERCLPNGAHETVSARRLLVGDVVRVHAGQAFPGDGELISEDAAVDEALLTGESDPVMKRRGDAVVAGSFNLSGPVHVRLQRLGGETRFAQIVSLMEKASTERPRLAILADRIAAPFLVLVMLAAAGAAVYWWQVDHTQALSVAVAVLIVTCPCALSLATPAAMLSAAGALARGGVLVRRLQAFEALSDVNVVVFDKTGTLTHERLVVRDWRFRSGVDTTHVQSRVMGLAQNSLHPLSQAIANSPWLGDREAPQRVQETAGQGLEVVWADGQTWRMGSLAWCGLTEAALEPDTHVGPRVVVSDAHCHLATVMLADGLREDSVQADKD
jgi:Cu2+-exporting ATPase